MRVYYFWESRPGSAFPDYLSLCVETWQRNIPDAEVVRVTHANLAELSGGRVDVDRLKTFSLPLQSDIAAVAVLAEQPGMFLDADTVILPGFDPQGYSAAWLTMYGDPTHSVGGHATNFFYASRPENPVLLAWLDEANKRIDLQTSGLAGMKWALRRLLRGKPARVGWNFLGNAILDPLLSSRRHDNAIDLRDIAAHGYVQTTRFKERYPDIKGYHDIWYSNDFPIEDVLGFAADNAVCLQHSWTPDWYTQLSRDLVLEDGHLISRLLRHALGMAP